MATAAAGKKSTTSLSLFMEVFGFEVEEELLYCGYSNLGRTGVDGKMVHGTKRSMAESDSRGSDVETGERACRSRNVRDP